LHRAGRGPSDRFLDDGQLSETSNQRSRCSDAHDGSYSSCRPLGLQVRREPCAMTPQRRYQSIGPARQPRQLKGCCDPDDLDSKPVPTVDPSQKRACRLPVTAGESNWGQSDPVALKRVESALTKR
jgi:hypothetical protein